MAGPPQKHTRHRHSDAQLAALNDLYDHDDSPPLEERAALAHSLGMEPKAVNAWFANKRSASKKKSRGLIALDQPYINSAHTSTSPPPPSSHSNHHPRLQNDDDDDTRHSTPMYYRHPSPYHADIADAHHLDTYKPSFDGQSEPAFDLAPRRMRVRPTPKQREELERIFERSTHPSREEREALGERIGMRYQTVTNWFQNMRSISKKRLMEDDMDAQSIHSATYSDYVPVRHSEREHVDGSLQYPSGTSHPSLGPVINLPSGAAHASSHTHYSAPPHPAHLHPSTHSRRPDTAALLARPRRSRPEPYQLTALRKLFTRTQNPSIEERGALALEINMDVGKVTNWFRNLRQTARKRAIKHDDDESMNDYDSTSGPVSRASTPPPSRFSSSNPHHDAYPGSISSSVRSRSSASGDEEAEHVMDVDRYTRSGRPSQHPPRAPSISLYGPAGERALPFSHQHQHQHHHSDGASEDDYEEAVTPPPAPAPVPSPPVSVAPVPRVVTSGRNRMDVGFLTGSSESVASEYARGVPPVVVKQEGMHVESAPKVEDAMLLLGFSRTVQW